MTLSTSHKALFAVLALAVAALLFDWMFLRGDAARPSQARASIRAVEPQLAAPPDAPPEPPAPAETNPAPEQLPLPRRMERLAEALHLDPAQMRDAFSLSDAWLAELKAPEPAAPERDPAKEFAEQHRLTSVILIGTGGSAVVDGRAIRVGQELDGFRLVRLTPAGAIFQCGDSQAELRLRTPADTP